MAMKKKPMPKPMPKKPAKAKKGKRMPKKRKGY